MHEIANKNPTKIQYFPSLHSPLTHALHHLIRHKASNKVEMKDRIERCVILPFSLGCSKHSSVAVAATTHHQHKKPNQLIKGRNESDNNGFLVQKEDTKIDNNGANISDKIIRSFKSFSHFFICYKESREEREAEMEIGFPTDVKHLTHIGVDGTMTTFDVSSSSFPIAPFHLTAV